MLFKVLVYMLVLSIIACALLVAIFAPIANDLFAEASALTQGTADDATAITGASGIFDALKTFADNLYTAFTQSAWLTTRVALLILAVLIVAKFFTTIVLTPIAHVMYNRITQNYDPGFANGVVATFAKSVRVAFVASVFTTITDLAILAFCIFVAIITGGLLGIFSGTLAFTLFIALYSLRLTLIGQWIPNMVTKGLNVRRAFIQNFKTPRRMFANIYACTAIMVLVTIGIITSTIIGTLGIVPICAVAFCMIYLVTVNLVANCRIQKQDYYIDRLTVVSAKAQEEEIIQ